MKKEDMTAPRRFGTITAEEAMRLIGDDPQTLELAIQVMERLIWMRRRLGQKGRIAKSGLTR